MSVVQMVRQHVGENAVQVSGLQLVSCLLPAQHCRFEYSFWGALFVCQYEHHWSVNGGMGIELDSVSLHHIDVVRSTISLARADDDSADHVLPGHWVGQRSSSGSAAADICSICIAYKFYFIDVDILTGRVGFVRGGVCSRRRTLRSRAGSPLRTSP